MDPHEQLEIWVEDERLGPFSAAELWQRIDAGEFDGSELVIRRGQPPCTLERWAGAEGEGSRREGSGQREELFRPPPSVSRAVLEHASRCEREAWQAFEPGLTPPAPGEQGTDVCRVRVAPERLLWEGRPSLRSRPSLVLLALAGLLPAILHWSGVWPTPPLWWLACLLASVLVWLLWPLTTSARYRVTSCRVQARRGGLVSSSQEIHLGDVRAIDCHRRGLAGLLGSGTLEFRSGADGGRVRFERIAAPVRVERLVRRAQRADL